MSTIHQHFQELKNNIDKVIRTLLELHPNEAGQVQQEVFTLCEELLSSLKVSVLPQDLETCAQSQTQKTEAPTAQNEVTADAGKDALSGGLHGGESCTGSDAATDSAMTHGDLIEADHSSSMDYSPPEPDSSKDLPPLDRHMNAVLKSSQLLHLPNDIVQPSELFVELQGQLPKEHRSWASILTRLFYAIGSPESFLRLRDACRFIRRTPFKARPVSIGSSELAETIQALDSLEDTDCVASILRRYHLSRLLAYRNSRWQHHQPRFPEVRVTKFKHGHMRVTQARRNEGQRTAASRALKDLLVEAYPQLHDENGQPLNKASGPHQRAYRSVKRRLGNGRNWLDLSEAFSPGIFSLVPTGGDFSIHNHQIETIPAAAFQPFLSLLISQRGGFLRMASTMLSKGIFDILMCRGIDQVWYPLENFSEETCESEGFDSFAFVTGCTSKAGENPRKSNPRFLGGDGMVSE